MKLYVTRHGQVADDAEYIDGNASLPRGEVPLSALGREQAVLLGKFLKKRNFSGKILSSPLWRTMETAELIAEETGAAIYPVGWMHEIFANQDYIDEYDGSPLEKLRAVYPHTAEDAVLAHPWWTLKAETSDDVKERVRAGIDALIAEFGDTDEEFLLVGHGASAGAANRYLDLKRGGVLWNCCIGMYDTKHPERNYGKNVSFLPGQMVTNNKVVSLEYPIDEGCQTPFGIQIPDEVKSTDSFKLLHIGDTHSATYSFYKQLIRLVKPDVIIHTGDTADEDKVGCDASVRESYLMKVKILADILKGANCPVYWVPGNNDLPDEVAKIAPFFKITEPDTVLEIEGTNICVSHAFAQITKKAEYYLYGHGTAADSFENELSLKGTGALCLNNMWSIQVITLPEKKIYHIETPA